MSKLEPPPVADRNALSDYWLRWYHSIRNNVAVITGLTINRLLGTDSSGELESKDLVDFITGILGVEIVDDGDGTVTAKRAKWDITTHTDDKSLVLADLRQIHIMNSADEKDFDLPSVGEDDVGEWVLIGRAGSGALDINAADSDMISNSTAGGRLRCEEASRPDAFVLLILVEETRWWIPQMHGIWAAY